MATISFGHVTVSNVKTCQWMDAVYICCADCGGKPIRSAHVSVFFMDDSWEDFYDVSWSDYTERTVHTVRSENESDEDESGDESGDES